MTPFPYFAYTLFHTYPKILKLVLLETRLNKLSIKKKESLKNEVGRESYGQNKLDCLRPNLGTRPSLCLQGPVRPFSWEPDEGPSL